MPDQASECRKVDEGIGHDWWLTFSSVESFFLIAIIPFWW